MGGKVKIERKAGQETDRYPCVGGRCGPPPNLVDEKTGVCPTCYDINEAERKKDQIYRGNK